MLTQISKSLKKIISFTFNGRRLWNFVLLCHFAAEITLLMNCKVKYKAVS